MMFTAVFAAAVLVAGVSAQAPDPSIQTPSGVTECEVTSLTFTGTHPPFIISAIPGGQVGSAPLETIVSGISSSPYPWLVNLDQGTYFTLQIRDSSGNLQYSAATSVLAGTNTSCINNNSGGTTIANTGSPSSAPLPSGSSTPAGASTTPAGTSAPAGSSAPATSSPAGSTPAGSTPAATSKTSAASTSSAAATTTTKSAAALKADVKSGAAGVLAVLAAAVAFA